MSEPKLIYSSSPDDRHGAMKTSLNYLEQHMGRLAIPINGSLERCPKCQGFGQTHDGKCEECNGTGFVPC